MKAKAKNKVVKKKAIKRKTFLTAEDKAQLLEAFNAARVVIDTTMECGSAMVSDVHDAQHKVSSMARKLGFKQENCWSNFTI